MGADNVYGTLLNDDVVSLVNGMVLRISDDDRVVRAQADAAPNLQGLVGVNGSGTVGIGGPVNVVMTAVAQKVLCETGLTIAAGDTLYVSDTVPGRATNVAPVAPVAIGSVEDVGSYVLDARVFAAINIPAAATSGGGSAFPGFGGALAAVGVGTTGVSGLAARGDHGHATLSQPTSAALSAMAVTNLADGTPCYLASRDAIFRIMTSAKATNTWDTLASATAGRVWLRDVRISLKNCAVTAWTVNTTTGDDDAAGTGGAPLKTLSELMWRLVEGWLLSSVTVTVTGSMVATDQPVFTFRCAPSATFTITFTPTVIYTSTTGVVTAAAAGPGTGDNNFTDPAVPGGSFTAAGALAAGVIGSRVGVLSNFWFAKDKGATTARIAKPTAALANGDTYTASTLSTAQVMRFAEQRVNACVLQFARLAASSTWVDSSLRFDRCWVPSTTTMPAARYASCAFEGGALINQACNGQGATFTGNAGMFRGTGAQSVLLTLGNVTSSINGSITLQGCALQVQGGFCAIPVDLYGNDYTGAAGGVITASYWGIILWYVGALVGSGNTNYLFWAERMSQIAAVGVGGGAAIAVAGSSPSATPMHATGTPDFSVANYNNGAGVVNRGGNGVYPTQNVVDGPLIAITSEAATDAATVTMNNAPAGSPAAPTRYLVASDGKGGVYTIPSLT